MARFVTLVMFLHVILSSLLNRHVVPDGLPHELGEVGLDFLAYLLWKFSDGKAKAGTTELPETKPPSGSSESSTPAAPQ